MISADLASLIEDAVASGWSDLVAHMEANYDPGLGYIGPVDSHESAPLETGSPTSSRKGDRKSFPSSAFRKTEQVGTDPNTGGPIWGEPQVIQGWSWNEFLDRFPNNVARQVEKFIDRGRSGIVTIDRSVAKSWPPSKAQRGWYVFAGVEAVDGTIWEYRRGFGLSPHVTPEWVEAG